MRIFSSIIIRIVLFLCFVNSIISCTNNDLGKGYYFMDKEKALDIGYPYGQIIYQSNYSSGRTHDIKKIITADVIDYKYNEDYIIAKQIPNEKIIIQEIEDNLSYSFDFFKERNEKIIITFFKEDIIINKFSDRKQIKSIADSILKNNNDIQNMFKNGLNYYVIDKNRNTIFGPFDENSFEIIKKEKNINLEFKE